VVELLLAVEGKKAAQQVILSPGHQLAYSQVLIGQLLEHGEQVLRLDCHTRHWVILGVCEWVK
jgi:hypothetical protein